MYYHHLPKRKLNARIVLWKTICYSSSIDDFNILSNENESSDNKDPDNRSLLELYSLCCLPQKSH